MRKLILAAAAAALIPGLARQAMAQAPGTTVTKTPDGTIEYTMISTLKSGTSEIVEKLRKITTAHQEQHDRMQLAILLGLAAPREIGECTNIKTTKTGNVVVSNKDSVLAVVTTLPDGNTDALIFQKNGKSGWFSDQMTALRTMIKESFATATMSPAAEYSVSKRPEKAVIIPTSQIDCYSAYTAN